MGDRRGLDKDMSVMERGLQKGPVGKILGFVGEGPGIESQAMVQWSDGRVVPVLVSKLFVVQLARGECR